MTTIPSSGAVRRSAIRARIDEKVRSGNAILIGGAPNGLIARAQIASGVDILTTYNIAAFRADGHASLLGYLPYGDANAITMELGRRILPTLNAQVPLLGGVGAADPYRDLRAHLTALSDMGFSGVINTPTAGVYTGEFRSELEAQGIGYAREVELCRVADQLDLFSAAYAFTPGDAAQLAEAGADLIIAHLGTTGGSEDHSAAVASAITATIAIQQAAVQVNPDAYVIVHGGPLEEPATVREVLSKTAAVGFLGGSGIDRLPVVAAVRATVAELGGLRLGPDAVRR
ncbi:MAG: phosphoenolpyruvate hydrolase family protein [Microbacteriaceae bacterium]|nr:phosphoenolpyruvate hydrolase family protein [Microbacteriaceae bacterium]